tara:strand:+ start:556 stop:1167 length:612 start_codon:yes stop_codon:yes gene_type:complete
MCQKCGCNTCKTKSTALVLNESKAPSAILSGGLKHHIDNDKPLIEHFCRRGSKSYFNLFAEARSLYSRGILDFSNKKDLSLLTETNLGHFGVFKGKKVPLDYPMLNEAEFKHINSGENKIKLAIKDVEKKFRLKANRDNPPEYDQLSLNKIMLSKVLGREILGKEHQEAWEKLKKEYELKEYKVYVRGSKSIHLYPNMNIIRL